MHTAPRSQFSPLSSHCSPSSFHLAFTPLCLSYLCRSQSLATSRSLSTLSPSCNTLHAISYSIYVPLSLLLLSVSLSLIMLFLISCHPFSPSCHLIFSLPLTHSMYFSMRTHFYQLCIFPSFFLFFTYPALLFLLSITVFTCAEVGINLYQPISS